MKPIRIFYSPLSGRIYATNRYKELDGGWLQVTGEKFDVTEQCVDAVRQREEVKHGKAAD